MMARYVACSRGFDASPLMISMLRTTARCACSQASGEQEAEAHV